IPGVLGGFVAESVARKPVFSKELCVGCGRCVEICPAEALSLRNDELPTVGVRRDMCIRCYCCNEICPEDAVHLRRMPMRSWGRALARRLRRRE
ncbi:MAG: 4Fe-4S binding protein, partial [Thermoplasmata archaeon]|nr:4Fe-4S binding protein [Thermoplasmata archaeon]